VDVTKKICLTTVSWQILYGIFTLIDLTANRFVPHGTTMLPIKRFGDVFNQRVPPAFIVCCWSVFSSTFAAHMHAPCTSQLVWIRLCMKLHTTVYRLLPNTMVADSE